MKWKEIKGYEDYKISDTGLIKSFKRYKTGKLLKPRKGNGYYRVLLCKNNKQTNKYIHSLVWDHFGDKPRNGRKLQVDHIDENKLNNNILNLQLLTNRENVSKGKLQHKKSSKYTGVSWFKRDDKWRTMITINNKNIHLGYFNDEYEAHLVYEYHKKRVIRTITPMKNR